jgi:hypothetical protein
LKMSPVPALPSQIDPSVKKTNRSGATKSTHSVDQSYLVGKSTENFLPNILRVTNLSLGGQQ